MIFLILGRTGSGKDYLAGLLEKEGLRQLKSYTTRPKRYSDEDTHIFINPEDVDSYTDKIATTKINGYDYFATRDQLNNSDVYIIDPNGVIELLENLGEDCDYHFCLVYVYSDREVAKSHAVQRSDDIEKEGTIFDERWESENDQFSKFEDYCFGRGDYQSYPLYKYPNIFHINIKNVYDPDKMANDANELIEYYDHYITVNNDM